MCFGQARLEATNWNQFDTQYWATCLMRRSTHRGVLLFFPECTIPEQTLLEFPKTYFTRKTICWSLPESPFVLHFIQIFKCTIWLIFSFLFIFTFYWVKCIRENYIQEKAVAPSLSLLFFSSFSCLTRLMCVCVCHRPVYICGLCVREREREDVKGQNMYRVGIFPFYIKIYTGFTLDSMNSCYLIF